MKKRMCIATIVCAALLVAAIFGAAAMPLSGATIAYRQLVKLGYAPAKQPVEVTEVSIPHTFDDVYGRYNEVQRQAGYDWLPYRGKTVVRYTFVLNGGPLRGNVFLYRNKIIGGDVMTTAIDGFLQPLIPR